MQGPEPLIPGPRQAPGQVVAVVVSGSEAYLGWCSYRVSQPAPVDLMWPVLYRMCQGTMMPVHSWAGNRDDILSALMDRSNQTLRFNTFTALVYADQLQSSVIKLYHESRELLWPESCERFV